MGVLRVLHVIDGQEVPSRSGRTFESINLATGLPFGEQADVDRMPTEIIVVDRLVLVDAEELADDFHGQDLAVGQGRRRAALAQATLADDLGQGIVKQAEHLERE